MKMGKVMKVLIPLLLLLVVASGCGTGQTKQPAPNVKAAAKSADNNAVSTPAGGETTNIAVYYLKESNNEIYLAREVHKVPKTPKIAEAALNELIKGQPRTQGAYRVLSPYTKVLGIKIEQGLATVDFSPEVLKANVGASGEAMGIASIVNTLTEFPSIQKVAFTVDGSVDKAIDWWGHVGLSEQPFSRNLAVVNEPAIWVTSPVTGQVINSPVEIKGSARVFEAAVSFRLKDSAGKILAAGFATASEGAPGRGDFEYSLAFKPSAPGKGQIEVFSPAPRTAVICTR
jgi:hypothetical protein